MRRAQRTYRTAADRWAGIGPYYAMFPVAFANAVVSKFTAPGDVVLDPFAGRGTSIFSAAVLRRIGVGIELNPVGWVYARTKLSPAPREAVEDRICELGTRAERYRRAADELPEFFNLCFVPRVRRFLLAAREHLDWRCNQTDRTTMALLLVHLHGKRADSLSNQMRQTKSMSPDYALRWWRRRRMSPPPLDPVSFLTRKLEWRYARGVPEATRSHVYLGDSVTRLPELVARARSGKLPRVSLLFTSPPYFHLTNYHYDQWLRLWLLGGSPNAARIGGRHRGKFEDRVAYRQLLARVFGAAANIMKRDAVVYVRTDRRAFTYRTTLEVLRDVFPRKKLLRRTRPVQGPTQTQLFGNGIPQPGDVDLILLP
jgi:hypothetical protein